MLTSFSGKRFNVNILDRNRTKHFLIDKIDKLIYIQVSKEQYARKRIHNGCLVLTENPVTQNNCSVSLDKPRDAEQLPS